MCDKKIRAFKALTVTIGIYFLLGGQVHAYEGWNLQLEPMYMGVAGTDNHQANITTTTTTYSPSRSSSSTSTTTSQNFDLGGNGTFRGQLEYMPEDWGIGVSGWWFDASDSSNLNLNSSPPPSYNSPVTTSTTIYYSSNNFSFYLPPSSFDGRVLLTSANSSLGVWNVDAYGIKTLGEFQNGRINMTFGAKFGSIVNKKYEAFNQGPATNSFGYFSSEIGSATNSADASFLVGPSIGVQGLGKYGKHRLEGFLSQSVLIGNVDYETIASRRYSYSYPSYPYPLTYSSNTNLSDSETLAIPVTEMKIKYLYDVTENLSLGLGFFGSAWIDTPTTPALYNDRQYKTLFFYGGLGSINLRY